MFLDRNGVIGSEARLSTIALFKFVCARNRFDAFSPVNIVAIVLGRCCPLLRVLISHTQSIFLLELYFWIRLLGRTLHLTWEVFGPLLASYFANFCDFFPIAVLSFNISDDHGVFAVIDIV